MNHSDIQLRSDEVQELMSFIPSRIIRWGITVIFLTVLIMLYVSWLIQYPDVINARVKIVSTPPPIGLIARADGRLTLFVQDQSSVTAGTTLAIIENPADSDDVFVLQHVLEQFPALLARPQSLTNISIDRSASLGELQDTYNDFIKTLLSYQLILVHTSSNTSLAATAPLYGDHVSKLVHDKVILTEELDVSRKKFQSNKILLDKGLVSEIALAEYEQEFKNKKASLDYVNAEIQYVKNNLILSLELMTKQLESQIAEWEHTYLLRAPVSGVISLFEFWNNNQYVKNGSTVLTIIPHASAIVGKLLLPVAGSGKVEPGQDVYITCDSYPYREYGFVRGKVDTMSLIAHDNQYLVQVILTDGLKTTFNKELEFKQEMDGNARIITKKKRLIERIFSQFRHIFSSSVM